MDDRKSGKKVANMKTVDLTTGALLIAGALNWGFAGVFHLDLIAMVFGMSFGETSALSSMVYGVVGLSGLYQALTWRTSDHCVSPTNVGA